MKKIAFVPGRFSPPHKGHIKMLLWLLTNFDKVVIGIGSCYEVGNPRHPLLAIFREKMIMASISRHKIDSRRISFVHLEDFYDWDQWWDYIVRFAQKKRITHFVTGNEEDILRVMKEKKIAPPFKLVNPEKEMPKKYFFPYRATDLRNAIFENNYKLFKKIAASGTIQLLGIIGGPNVIREAMRNRAIRFVPGRQAVDLIVTCRGGKDNLKVLTGYRKKTKENFPDWLAVPGGAVNEYESPMDAAVRELKEETGLEVKFIDRYLEPAHVEVVSNKGKIFTGMRFVGLFSANDPVLAGNQGGSSQVFHIDLDLKSKNFSGILKSNSDLGRVAFRPVDKVLKNGLAYQQTDMLKKALSMI